MANRREKSGSSDRCYFLGLQNHLGDCSHEFPQKESYDKPRQCLKKQRHRFADKGPYSQSYDFSGSHVRMWELDHKEGWAPKNWWFWTVVLEKTLESPLDSKENKSCKPKGNQSLIFTGRTDAEAEAPIFWTPDSKSWLITKDSLQKMLGNIEGRRRRGKQRTKWLDSITDSMNMNLSKLWKITENRGTWCIEVHGAAEIHLT